MRTLLFLLQKEFRQIFRNKALLPMLFVVPFMQLLILPLAADYEMKNINIAVVDHDHSTYSQKLLNAVTSSGYFKLAGYYNAYKEAFALIETDEADLILEIPSDFEKNLVRENEQELFIAVNAINGSKASIGGAYLAQIIKEFNATIRAEWISSRSFQSHAGNRNHKHQLV